MMSTSEVPASDAAKDNPLNHDGFLDCISFVTAAWNKYNGDMCAEEFEGIHMPKSRPAKLTDSGHLLLPYCVNLIRSSINRALSEGKGETDEDLRSMGFDVTELDLSDNHFASVLEIIKIIRFMPKLVFLNLTRNLLRSSTCFLATESLAIEPGLYTYIVPASESNKTCIVAEPSSQKKIKMPSMHEVGVRDSGSQTISGAHKDNGNIKECMCTSDDEDCGCEDEDDLKEGFKGGDHTPSINCLRLCQLNDSDKEQIAVTVPDEVKDKIESSQMIDNMFIMAVDQNPTETAPIFDKMSTKVAKQSPAEIHQTSDIVSTSSVELGPAEMNKIPDNIFTTDVEQGPTETPQIIDEISSVEQGPVGMNKIPDNIFTTDVEQSPTEIPQIIDEISTMSEEDVPTKTPQIIDEILTTDVEQGPTETSQIIDKISTEAAEQGPKQGPILAVHPSKSPQMPEKSSVRQTQKAQYAELENDMETTCAQFEMENSDGGLLSTSDEDSRETRASDKGPKLAVQPSKSPKMPEKSSVRQTQKAQYAERENDMKTTCAQFEMENSDGALLSTSYEDNRETSTSDKPRDFLDDESSKDAAGLRRVLSTKSAAVAATQIVTNVVVRSVCAAKGLDNESHVTLSVDTPRSSQSRRNKGECQCVRRGFTTCCPQLKRVKVNSTILDTLVDSVVDGALMEEQPCVSCKQSNCPHSLMYRTSILPPHLDPSEACSPLILKNKLADADTKPNFISTASQTDLENSETSIETETIPSSNPKTDSMNSKTEIETVDNIAVSRFETGNDALLSSSSGTSFYPATSESGITNVNKTEIKSPSSETSFKSQTIPTTFDNVSKNCSPSNENGPSRTSAKDAESKLGSSVSGPFYTLRYLLLNATNLEWTAITRLLAMFPELEELHLSLNNYTIVDLPEDLVYPSLRRLFFNNNPLKDWKEWSKLGRAFPGLQGLFMGETHVCDIGDGDSVARSFPVLEVLSLNRTRIASWVDVDKLNLFPLLTDVRLQGIPFLEGYPETERREELVARLPKVSELNCSTVTEAERIDAEKAFVRKFINSDEKPNRYFELEQIHRPLDATSENTSLPHADNINVTVVMGQRRHVIFAERSQTVQDFKRSLENWADLTASRFMLIYQDKHGQDIPPMKIKSLDKTLKDYDIHDGDEFLIELKNLNVTQ